MHFKYKSVLTPTKITTYEEKKKDMKRIFEKQYKRRTTNNFFSACNFI